MRALVRSMCLCIEALASEAARPSNGSTRRVTVASSSIEIDCTNGCDGKGPNDGLVHQSANSAGLLVVAFSLNRTTGLGGGARDASWMKVQAEPLVPD